MSDLRDEMYSLETAQERVSGAFGKYLLPDLLRAINRACHEWAEGRLTTSISILNIKGGKNPLFYWAAGETARHAIWNCAQPAMESRLVLPMTRRSIDWASIEPLMRLAIDVQLRVPIETIPGWKERFTTSPIHSTVSRVWMPQYILQRNSPYRLGQAILMYRDAPRRRHARDGAFPLEVYEGTLARVLGTELERFLVALMQMFVASCGAKPELSLANLAPVGDSRFDEIVFDRTRGGLLQPSYSAVLTALSASPRVMESWSRERLGSRKQPVHDERVPFDGPNPLLRYPLVRCFSDRDDCCVAPVPNLLLEWLYEPLVDLLWAGCAKPLERSHLSEIFEEYVGLLADLATPSGPGWIPESELLRSMPSGVRVVDWVREIGDHVVLIDAKRCYIEPAARYRWVDADWLATKKEWAKGVRQAHEFWGAVCAGQVGRLPGVGDKQPVAVIVTHGDIDFHSSREDWRAEVNASISDLPAKMPWTVISLDRYETLMSAWPEHDDAWLVSMLLGAASDGPAAAFQDLEMAARGPIWEAGTRLVSSVEEAIADRTDVERD